MNTATFSVVLEGKRKRERGRGKEKEGGRNERTRSKLYISKESVELLSSLI